MGIPPLGPVLCPVDLSEQSQRALYHAAGFASVSASHLFVLKVDARADGPISGRAAVAQELDDFVRRTLPAWASGRTTTEIMIRGGVPADAIQTAADDVGAQLVVMGTRGRGALARALLGSTAAAVLRQSTVPVAVVPSMRQGVVSLGETHARFHFGSIVVPIDLQADSASQVLWAGRLSGGAEQPLLILHVVQPGHARGSEMDRIRAVAAGVEAANGYRAAVREGRVVPEVIAAVNEERAGVVVMGRSSDAPGAMAYEVLRRTDALVMMVP